MRAFPPGSIPHARAAEGGCRLRVSLINCSGLVFGSAGMVLVFLAGGENLVLSLGGAINMAVGMVCLAGGWAAIGRRGGW
ncbi:hypothetical protein [Methanoculleus chikugoensis]|uniref:hypothetical protein n=1 Tax=Methanoculleus chikugoensis TaxID=118126 RepID=UPI0006D1CB1A|nr:hypothetical protein [Methanoculleus chikugoensis]